MNGLSEMKAFLQLPWPCLSGTGPQTDQGSPGTGRVIFDASLLIGLAHPVEGSLSDGVVRRQRTAFGWPLQTAASFIALNLATPRGSAADENVLINCKRVSTLSRSPYLMKI